LFSRSCIRISYEKFHFSIINNKKLTQASAAKILGVSQSLVSDLITGKWEKFSLEMLITLVTKAGMHVKLKIAA